MSSNKLNKPEEILQNLSHEDFLKFGMQQIAYIKPEKQDGDEIFTVHAADGTALEARDSLDGAINLVRDKKLYPVTMH